MESALALLDDHVLGLSTPISLPTLLDLSPAGVTPSSARRAMAQFAADHTDRVNAMISVSYTDEHDRLSICIVPVDHLDTIVGVVLSTSVYSVEKRVDDDVRADRDRRLTSHRLSAEMAMPMLLRDPLIAYPDGHPQRLVVVAETDEAVLVKRKIEEVKDKVEPKEKEPSKKVVKEESASMKAFFSKAKNDPKPTPFSKASTKSAATVPFKKGTAVPKRRGATSSSTTPAAAPDRMAYDQSDEEETCFGGDEVHDEEHAREEMFDEDDRQSMVDEDASQDMVDEDDRQVQEDDQQVEAVAPKNAPDRQDEAAAGKKALSRTIESKTYVKNKYLVTEDVVKMVEKDVEPETKKTPSSTQARSRPKGGAAGAKPSKLTQPSMKSFFTPKVP